MATKPKAAQVAAPAPAPAVIEDAAPMVAAPIEVIAAVVEVAAEPTPVVEVAAEPTIEPLQQGLVAETPETAITAVNVNQHKEKIVKTAEDFVAFSQGNIEALVKSSQIWTAGVQDLSKQFAANAQAQFDETMSAFTTMTTMKSLKDVFELQSTLAKSALEKTVADSGKLTDASIKLTELALAPIAARVTTATEAFGKTA